MVLIPKQLLKRELQILEENFSTGVISSQTSVFEFFSIVVIRIFFKFTTLFRSRVSTTFVLNIFPEKIYLGHTLGEKKMETFLAKMPYQHKFVILVFRVLSKFLSWKHTDQTAYIPSSKFLIYVDHLFIDLYFHLNRKVRFRTHLRKALKE